MSTPSSSTVDTPQNTLRETLNGSLFGAIFAINTVVLFISVKDQGDLLAILLMLVVCALAVYVPIHVLYHTMIVMSTKTYEKHRVFLVSTYTFLSTVFKWIAMLAFSVFTQWLPGAFLNEPHLLNYMLFLLLTFFAFTFIMVVSGFTNSTQPVRK